jgi:hypothetical protein
MRITDFAVSGDGKHHRNLGSIVHPLLPNATKQPMPQDSHDREPVCNPVSDPDQPPGL